jgi:gamma-D-glutamyl-L-lysine dipeptidyl-peptidase
MPDPVSRMRALIERIRERHALDPRISVFEVDVERTDDAVDLTGVTSEAAAAEELHREAALLEGAAPVRDRVRRLPHVEPGEPIHAVATAAVVPLLAGPTISETHVSQAVLGRTMTVLRREGRWLQCRSDDGYLGWVHRGYVALLDEAGARAWEMGTGGEACVSLGAKIMDADGDTLARLPWGARVVRGEDGHVRLPDGTTGPATGTLLPLADRAERYPADGERMTATAARWMGAPYLWGGVTPAGVDCSGFVQAVLDLHGVRIPRDSDLQAQRGEPVEPDERFSNLRAGDLLFFAETPERISHVTLSLGGSRIIHSSLGNGGVRRNDLVGDTAYERELRGIFVCARRYV